MSGPTLFDHPVEPPSVAVDTSMDAAQRVKPKASSLRLTCLRLIVAYQGQTCDELEVRLDAKHQTIAARLWELEGQGLAVKSEIRRPTRSGVAARVYVATAKGYTALKAAA